ncbi:MAG: AAA family ATPase, partial [Myxococcota bacterium]
GEYAASGVGHGEADIQVEHTTGTPMYMAPEQAAGVPPSAAADWYAFGVIIYQALAGRLPFRGPASQVLARKQDSDPLSPSAYTDGIPEDLEALCMELLSRDPDERPHGYDVLTRLGVASEKITRQMQEVTFVGPDDFVGRSEHLAQLKGIYREIHSGITMCVFAQGASGMGKTTLLRRFVYELEADYSGREDGGPLILPGRCHERESLSYKAFDGVIDRLSRELLKEPGRRVEQLLPDDIDLLTRLFPVLRRIPGVQSAWPMGGRNLLEQRARAVAALRELLDNLGAWRPVVIRIEDLQWADSDSLDLLVDLLSPPAPRRLLILASLRTDGPVSNEIGGGKSVHEVIEALADQVSVHRLDIGPLTSTEQQLLVAKLAGQRQLPPGIGDEFWAEAEGNPLLLAELARYAAEAPEVVGAYRRPQLDDVISSRIERLTDTARALLDIIAVAGEPTPLSVLAEAIDQSDDDRERASATLRVAKLARIAMPGHEPWFNVQHDKIRETVLGNMPERRRRFLHARMAGALERWDGAAVPALAHHWLGAGDRGQAAIYLIAAADTAGKKLAFERAAELYRVAHDLLESGAAAQRIAVLRPLGEVLTFAGRYHEAALVYNQAAGLADGELATELSRHSADSLLRSGRIREGVQKSAEVMKQLG